MAVSSHQTARLSAGRHRSPQEGACTIELVSMLVDAPFSDNPACVCPSLAAFVRGYNDHIDDRRRQDLIALAPDLVDSRGDAALTDDHAFRCIDFAAREHAAVRRLWGAPPLFTYDDCAYDLELAGRLAARAARRRKEVHARTLGFIRSLAREARDALAPQQPDLGADHDGDRPPVDVRNARPRPAARASS